MTTSALAQVEAEVESIAQAQQDATDALNVANAAGVAGDANETAAQAISDAAANQAAQDAQTDAINANSAAIAVQATANESAVQTIMTSGKTVSDGGVLLSITSPSSQNKYILIDANVEGRERIDDDNKFWMTLNGAYLQYRVVNAYTIDSTSTSQTNEPLVIDYGD